MLTLTDLLLQISFADLLLGTDKTKTSCVINFIKIYYNNYSKSILLMFNLENGVKSMQNNPVNRSLEATTSTENSPTHIFTSAYSAAAAFNPVQVTSEMSRYSQSHRPFSPTPSLAPQMLRTHQEEVDGSCAHRAVRRYFLLLTIGFAVTVLISSLFTAIICLKLNDRIQSLIHRFKRARLLRGNRTNEYTY